MNELQMMILELYAGAKDEQELNALMLRDELSCMALAPMRYVARGFRATWVTAFELRTSSSSSQ